MKKAYLSLSFFLITVVAIAQENQPGPKFSPEKFDADLQEFITKEANLTPGEAEKFFPIYKEMQGKQRALYGRMRDMGRQKPQDEAGCMKAIKERDDVELEMKRIQQTYHNKFLELLPATKVFDILSAEDRFHRRMIRGWNGNGRPNGNGRHNGNVPHNRPQQLK